MSRIQGCFRQLSKQGYKALVPYVTAGDPTLQVTIPLLHELVTSGADILELGVPFSDPMADGPIIQAAYERALAQGVNLRQVLEIVADFRTHDAQTPIILMGYLNPIEAMGYDQFANRAAGAGVDGVLTVDAPPEESHALRQALIEQDLDPIYLLAPTTPPQRIAQICAAARGFIYYVSLKGTTGSSALDIDSVERKLREVRTFTDLPVGVGFGIRDPESAFRIAKVADAVIVGSAVVQRIQEGHDDNESLRGARQLIQDMRVAMNAA